MADPPQKLVRLSPNSVGLNGPRIVNQTQATRNHFCPYGTSNADIVAKLKDGDRHVIFNCHGHPTKPEYPAHLEIGQTFKEDNVQVCEPWMRISSLRVIWLSACNIGGSGRPFCAKLAKTTGCFVVTQTFAALDRAVKPGTVEYCYYGMPAVISPSGDPIGIDDFKKKGKELSFAFPA
jgi:hypothetical protein